LNELTGIEAQRAATIARRTCSLLTNLTFDDQRALRRLSAIGEHRINFSVTLRTYFSATNLPMPEKSGSESLRGALGEYDFQ
jgi:hypothetical protein